MRAFVRDMFGAILLHTGITSPRRRLERRLTVVTFHRVLPQQLVREYPLPWLAVTPEQLAWFLEFFVEHFTIAPLCEHLTQRIETRPSTRPLLAVTFDDGQLDNFHYARPVLDRFAIRASFFVTVAAATHNAALWHDRVGFAYVRAVREAPVRLTALFGEYGIDIDLGDAMRPRTLVATLKRRTPQERTSFANELEHVVSGTSRPCWDGMMSFSDMVELANDGHEIGSHGMTHECLPQCSGEALVIETVNSRRSLEHALGRSVVSFCYPNGDYDHRVVDAVRSAGYLQAVTTIFGANFIDDPAFTLRRFDVQSEYHYARTGALSRARTAWRMSGLYPGLRS